jgi:hypothetical protein
LFVLNFFLKVCKLITPFIWFVVLPQLRRLLLLLLLPPPPLLLVEILILQQGLHRVLVLMKVGLLDLEVPVWGHLCSLDLGH